MTSGLVVHVEHNGETRTEVFTGERVHIGHDATCDICLPLDAALSSPIELEIAFTDGHYAIVSVAPGSNLTHNKAPLRSGAIIRDADEVRCTGANLSLRFYPIGLTEAMVATAPNEVERHSRATLAGTNALAGTNLTGTNLTGTNTVHVAPFIEHAAIEAAATARRDDAKVFLREFTRELVREISPVTKIITLLIALSLIGGTFFFVHEIYANRKEAERSRMEAEALREQFIALRQQMGATTEQISEIDKKNQQLVDILSIAPQIAAKYSGGVCLIAGTYQWYETGTNRPLRYRQSGVDEDGVPQPTEAEGEDAALTPDGNGSIAQFDFVGTGFHVGSGFILTNRHVASRPWEADPRSQYLTGAVPARARVVRIVAFFPNRRQPLPLRLRTVSSSEDLALCSVDAGDDVKAIPVLPLDNESGATGIGKDVAMMGYPSGPDRLLALLSETQSRQAQARYSASLEGLIGYLASQNLVRPLMTRGTITDLLARRIVYDARTAEGGSGAPIFGQSGRVIGVNFAVLPSNSASNFAVPIRYARELLERTGWRSPETATDEAADEAADAPTEDAVSATARATPSPNTPAAASR